MPIQPSNLKGETKMKKMNNMDNVIVLAAQNHDVAKALAEVEACEIAIKNLKTAVIKKLAGTVGNDKAAEMVKFVTSQVHMGVPMERYKGGWTYEVGTRYEAAYMKLLDAQTALEEMIEKVAMH